MPELRKDIIEELDHADIRLTEQPDPRSMRVPEGYFGKLEAELLQVIALEKKHSGKVIRMRIVRSVCAVAAVFSLVFFGTRLLRPDTQDYSPEQLASLSDSDLDAVINERLAALSFDDMHTYLTDNMYDLETSALFSTEYIDAEMLEEKLHSDVKEHISSDAESSVVDTENKVLEDHVYDDMEIEQEDIDGYLLDEALFDGLGL